MYEVKGSTGVRSKHGVLEKKYLNDVSIQWYALSKRIKLNRAFVIHLDNTYVREGELEVQKLFAIDDVTAEVKEEQSSIVTYSQGFEKGKIKDLAEIFEPLSDDLLALNERFVDIAHPFQHKHYYHPKLNGRYSISSECD